MGPNIQTDAGNSTGSCRGAGFGAQQPGCSANILQFVQRFVICGRGKPGTFVGTDVGSPTRDGRYHPNVLTVEQQAFVSR